MLTSNNYPSDDFDFFSKVHFDLMEKQVSEILLVASSYDAFIMEEYGQLAERIANEYQGLKPICPPRLTQVSSDEEALFALRRKKFDLVIIIPRLRVTESYALGRKIKKFFQNLSVFLLVHHTDNILFDPQNSNRAFIDKVFYWTGDPGLPVAMIHCVEDRINAPCDTAKAGVRVILLAGDCPETTSSLLPLLYQEIRIQTQSAVEESLNKEHCIFKMHARPKVLVAKNFQEAETLYKRYKHYLLGVLSDVCQNGKKDEPAGFSFLAMTKKESPGIPLLILSSEEKDRKKTSKIDAVFLNKNSQSLYADIHSFLIQHLGFGDFIFRLPDSTEVTRASSLCSMASILPSIPDESIYYHASRNDFSRWLMARSEIQLASKLLSVKASSFPNALEIKNYIISSIQKKHKKFHQEIVTDLVPDRFDPNVEFIKIGKGSLGGKARGLAFISGVLKKNDRLQEEFPDVDITVPKMVVISTEGFDAFVNQNHLKDVLHGDFRDTQIQEIFLASHFPDSLRNDLELFLTKASYPLAVRSSSLLEDAQYIAHAGIYKTYMLPNTHPDPGERMDQLTRAIKLVYASTYLELARSYSKSTPHRLDEEKMAVIIQQVVGKHYGNYFYPSVSGIAQSYNFYPVSYMKPEEGIVHIALGFGKTVVEGGKALRFSPKYPQFLPQFSMVEDILDNSQRSFYAMKMNDFSNNFGAPDDATLVKLKIDTVKDHAPVQMLSSTYNPEDHRIRDNFNASGHMVLTFASILKNNSFPLSEIVSKILEIGRKGMGCPVEIEFAVNLPLKEDEKTEFSLLQIRPMAYLHQGTEIEISDQEIQSAFCFSNSAMGNGKIQDIADIIFIKPDSFEPARTVEAAYEISRINKILLQQKRRYLLIGPGRWGSADKWLGIPVKWNDISGVGALIETPFDKLSPDPSQGTHFFHNITSLGISHITISQTGEDFIDWQWLQTLPFETETDLLRHVRVEKPIIIKINGKKSRAVLLPGELS